jgi:predicted homoserine dehydrogenase-like protein
MTDQSSAQPVRAAVIGAGAFGTAIVTQSAAAPLVDVCVVADQRPENAVRAFRHAGFENEEIAECDSRQAAITALEAGKRVVLEAPLLAVELPVEVIVEATGAAEAGAQHAQEAIRHGRHVVMVNKEADAVVGPILKHRADREGVSYLPADGDQHGLLIALAAWARELGLEVICGGKARVGEFVLDETDGGLSVAGVRIPPDKERFFSPIPSGKAREFVTERAEVLREVRQVSDGDMEEMAIAANATGLMPETELMHHPILRTREIPEVLCSARDGGILGSSGAIETITCLRRPAEAGLGGVVFIVVSCDNEASRRFLIGKAHVANAAGTATLIARPYHLCGVETPTSILAAAGRRPSPTAQRVRPRVDVVARTVQALAKGERVTADVVRTEMHPARRVGPRSPLPFRMALGAAATTEVPPGTLLTCDMIEEPADSALWELRREQDARFL